MQMGEKNPLIWLPARRGVNLSNWTFTLPVTLQKNTSTSGVLQNQTQCITVCTTSHFNLSKPHLCSALWRGRIWSLSNPNKQVRLLLAPNSRCKCNFIFNFNSLAVTHGRATSKLQPCTWGHYLHFYILCRFSAYGNILTLHFFFFFFLFLSAVINLPCQL